MAKITVDTQNCKGCLLCVAACPRGLIKKDERLNKKGFNPVKCVDAAQCSGCCLCAVICPDCCIEVYKENT
ncbi:MAG: 4Fe-4S binding protein [Candidatus Omnitrophica bacterium]|nr:4Fe-4S binding protein [Candidatus Omnitrophota bacterium]